MIPSPLHYDTPFHLLTGACELEDAERLLPVFASSAMEVFPFQVAAANFALKAEYLKGAVLCDEGALGKTFEALMLIAQKWFEKRDRILIVVPLPLLRQWREVMEKHFTFPYAVAGETLPEGVVLTTYEWAAAHSEELAAVCWDLAVLEEAHRLRKENRERAAITAALHNTAFKLLLTATPLTTSIMDLHSLISLIDPAALPEEKEFYKCYFRHEERYGELAGIVGKYCFRTTRNAVKSYLQIPHRVAYTAVFSGSPEEKEVYSQLESYWNRETKHAFPVMEKYDLALMLSRTFSSSSAALEKLVTGVLDRLGADDEASVFQAILSDLRKIPVDTKAQILLKSLRAGFAELRKRGAAAKCLIFTENRATQSMLEKILAPHWKVVCYHGGEDQAVLKFQKEAQIMVATDAAAEGFNLEFCSFLVNYDLPYNTLTVEQRINRCHRQNQKSDVLVLNFLNRENFADVRTLELVNKRMAQFNGIIGLSDDVLGSIGGDFDATLAGLRPRSEIEKEAAANLAKHAAPNQQLLKETGETLFSSFTPEVARNVRLTPEYVKDRCEELNAKLWAVTKGFFSQFPAFQFDDETRTFRCPDPPPKVFTGARLGRNEYSMAPDYQPRSGRHTLTGSLTRNLLGEIHWRGVPESGVLAVDAPAEPCRIALYQVKAGSGTGHRFAGKTASGRVLADEECRALLKLPVVRWQAQGEIIGEHNRYQYKTAPDELDALLKTDEPDSEAAAKQKQAFALRKRELEKQLEAAKNQEYAAALALENAASRMEKISLQKRHAEAIRACKEAEQRLFLCVLDPVPCKAPVEAARLFTLKIQPSKGIKCRS
jgi:superfamily II DNA or RNA helicase